MNTINEEIDIIIHSLEEKHLNFGIKNLTPKQLFKKNKDVYVYQCNDLLLEITRVELVELAQNNPQDNLEQLIQNYVARRIIDRTLKGSKYYSEVQKTYSWN